MTDQNGGRLFANEGSSAVLSLCGRYRYRLQRRWDDGPILGWMMLNPSTADADVDDPTIRRCIGYARRWWFSGIWVSNLFAIRSSDPAEIWKVSESTERVGPENDYHIKTMLANCEHVVGAWGTSDPRLFPRVREVMKLGMTRFWCLGVTKGAWPKHPLYCRADLWPQIWE